MSEALEFVPYKNYIELFEYIEKFVSISSLSYGLTKQLLDKHEKCDLEKIETPKPNMNELSFSMADLKVKNVDFVCGWLTCSQYAKKIDSSEENVVARAGAGEFGVTSSHPESGKTLLIWPEKYQSKQISELPEPGKSKFKPTVSIIAKADISIDTDDLTGFEDKQKQLLKFAHAVGDKEKVSSKAETMLFQSSFLLNWTAFEVFVRESIHELYRLHPKKLIKGQKGAAQTLSYKDIFELSSEFESIDSLKESLVEMEIKKHQRDGASISGLINFLKSEFKFKNDPYKAWYTLNGDRKEATFDRVLEIKEVRNALMHNAGKDVDSIISEYPHLKKNAENLIIDEEYYSETSLIMKSIAFSIAKDVSSGEYRTSNC